MILRLNRVLLSEWLNEQFHPLQTQGIMVLPQRIRIRRAVTLFFQDFDCNSTHLCSNLHQLINYNNVRPLQRILV